MSRSFYRIVNNTVHSPENHRLKLQAQPTRSRKIRICMHGRHGQRISALLFGQNDPILGKNVKEMHITGSRVL